MSFYSSFGTPVTIVRPFNTYGPRQSARAVIPSIITQIASGERFIKLGSLHPTRDFNYISDTVAGFIAVAEAENTAGQVINIGCNFEISIGDTLEAIIDIMQAEVEIQTDDIRIRPELSEVERLWADNSKALALTSWKPDYSGLDGFRRGLEETISWFRQPANLRLYKSDRYNI